MNISYLSTVRLPTNKAYGVTVIETANAATRMGLNFKLFAPSNRSYVNSNLVRINSVGYCQIKIKHLRKLINLLIFQYNSIYIPIVASFYSDLRRSDLIWLRDPLSALVLSTLLPRKSILVEIHHKPRTFNSLVFKLLRNKKYVRFGLITKTLQKELEKSLLIDQMVLMPMAVSSDFYQQSKDQLTINPISLVYLGKGQSSGHDNGLITLVEDFMVANAKYPKLKLVFVGLEDSFEFALRQRASDNNDFYDNVEFYKHVPHSEVPNLLAKFSIGLLPYPDSRYNNERFPLKSLEYAALGLPILATSIRSHRELMGSDICWFYHPGVPGSFSAGIDSILSSPSGTLQKILKARTWASDYTYEKRVVIAMNAFPDLNRENGWK